MGVLSGRDLRLCDPEFLSDPVYLAPDVAIGSDGDSSVLLALLARRAPSVCLRFRSVYFASCSLANMA